MSAPATPSLTIRGLLRQLGWAGLVFAVALVAFFPLYFWISSPGLLALDIIVLIPFGAWQSFRFTRWVIRHSIWGLRNRLLVVYALIGILPIVLILALVGLSAWALTSELAIYLASSELDRRLESIQTAAEGLRRTPVPDRRYTAPKMLEFYTPRFPGIAFYTNDASGRHHYPPEADELDLPKGWSNVNGLLYRDGEFYGWAHVKDEHDEITIVAPMSRDLIADLVPHLGEIRLLENVGDEGEKDLEVKTTTYTAKTPLKRVNRIPPAMNRFDIYMPYASTKAHSDWSRPGHTHLGLLVVWSRPSAVLASIFSSADAWRGALYDAVVVVGVLFLLVEIVALFIGVSLSRRITGAVNELYEGTRRVIFGDFRHRIPVGKRDQLGELAESFNQMTGNLERLLVVEKEKERLQTELEIAREVQNQLYPKVLPPTSSGLHLTVHCEPARMVSGDYYDYQLVPRGQLAFAIGDVAGKGISAALLMATVQSSLRAQVTHANEANDGSSLCAATLVSRLNKQLYANTAPEKYATFFFATYDEKTGVLTYTNAGHLPPLLVRKGEVLPLDVNGTVVGAFPFSRYDESHISMEPGDLLVCYTDGVTEPENAYGEMFGEERLIELVLKYAGQQEDAYIIHTVIEAVRSWTATPELFDDMTLLFARCLECP